MGGLSLGILAAAWLSLMLPSANDLFLPLGFLYVASVVWSGVLLLWEKAREKRIEEWKKSQGKE